LSKEAIASSYLLRITNSSPLRFQAPAKLGFNLRTLSKYSTFVSGSVSYTASPYHSSAVFPSIFFLNRLSRKLKISHPLKRLVCQVEIANYALNQNGRMNQEYRNLEK
jgi:hypothetical protein